MAGITQAPSTLAYNLVIQAYSAIHPARPEEAERVLLRMLERGAVPDGLTYTHLLGAFAQVRLRSTHAG